MRGYVGNTDYDWFTYLRAIEPPIDEVNFWRPGSQANFSAIEPGEPFFFKLKAPHNAIGGFGYFVKFSLLPVSIAWQYYGEANGAPSQDDWRRLLYRYRSSKDRSTDPKADFWIGCILVNQTVFFEKHEWIRMPSDFRRGIQQGKGYDLTSGEGQRIWLECLSRASARPYWRPPYPLGAAASRGLDILSDAPITGGYGPAALIRPRLGQRSFRVAVLDSYGRRCTITNERTLPVLEAAHIREYHDVQEHTLGNGILFRADIHKLFDAGYVTVTPDYHFEVSRRIKEEFENGRDYYAVHGSPIRLPAKPADRPDRDSLAWHNANRYRG